LPLKNDDDSKYRELHQEIHELSKNPVFRLAVDAAETELAEELSKRLTAAVPPPGKGPIFSRFVTEAAAQEMVNFCAPDNMKRIVKEALGDCSYATVINAGLQSGVADISSPEYDHEYVPEMSIIFIDRLSESPAQLKAFGEYSAAKIVHARLLHAWHEVTMHDNYKVLVKPGDTPGHETVMHAIKNGYAFCKETVKEKDALLEEARPGAIAKFLSNEAFYTPKRNPKPKAALSGDFASAAAVEKQTLQAQALSEVPLELQRPLRVGKPLVLKPATAALA